MVANVNATIWLHKYFVKRTFVSDKWMEVFEPENENELLALRGQRLRK
jgi:hypothetical protein